MSDLIRREDALDAIQKRADKVDSVYSAFWEGLKIAQDIVENIPSAESERKWIPVTEALPEEKGEYLVSYHPCHWNTVSEKVLVGMDTFRGKTTWAKKKYQKVIAWMPLPEVYRGD